MVTEPSRYQTVMNTIRVLHPGMPEKEAVLLAGHVLLAIDAMESRTIRSQEDLVRFARSLPEVMDYVGEVSTGLKAGRARVLAIQHLRAEVLRHPDEESQRWGSLAPCLAAIDVVLAERICMIQ